MILRFFRAVGGWLEIALACTALFVTVGFFFKVLAEFWPVTTALFVFFGTMGALDNRCRTTKTMCVGGLIIYALGWAVSWNYGPFVGSVVCVAGFLLWFEAGVQAYWGPFMVPPARTC